MSIEVIDEALELLRITQRGMGPDPGYLDRYDRHQWVRISKCIEGLEKLKQQEPVAWSCDGGGEEADEDWATHDHSKVRRHIKSGGKCIKLYAAPVPPALELAASQARELQLREAVRQNHEWHNNYDEYGGYPESELCEVNTETLSKPTDNSALEALIARAGEVMRERCSLSVLLEHGGPEDECRPALEECSEAIRALPGVTLEDLK